MAMAARECLRAYEDTSISPGCNTCLTNSAEVLRYNGQRYCSVQSADHGAPSRWRRVGVDPILQIDRAALLKLAVHAQTSSINHDRPPLTPDASISTTPNQCKSNPKSTSNIPALLLPFVLILSAILYTL